MYDFENRVLLLTGANGGIGREIAQLFYRHGAYLVLTDIDKTGVAEFASALDPSGRRVVTLGMDAADPSDSDRAVEAAEEHFGGIDFLVPAAGLYLAQAVHGMNDTQWRQTLSINLDGVFYICQRSIRLLRENSAICNITSLAAHRGSHYNAHYAASKGGVLALTRSLARELGPRTRVNSVSPGIIETAMTTDLIRRRGAESIDQTPLKRLGHPREIATAAGFLCSSGASYVTGEVLHVNGGFHIGG